MFNNLIAKAARSREISIKEAISKSVSHNETKDTKFTKNDDQQDTSLFPLYSL